MTPEKDFPFKGNAKDANLIKSLSLYKQMICFSRRWVFTHQNVADAIWLLGTQCQGGKKMIPYLRIETIKNYTLSGGTNLNLGSLLLTTTLKKKALFKAKGSS